MAQNLFALSQAGGGASEANKPLVAFRAGKCTFQNGTVTPINKKGLVQVLQTPDSLLHFQWKDRTTGTVEDDLIIFPEEAQFVKATPTARVFLLKFTSGRKLFFWLQEPKDDKDKDYEEKINQYINNPPPPEQPAGGSLGSTMGNLQGLAGMDESQLRQMFQAVTGGGNTAQNSAQPPARATQQPSAAPTPATTQAPTTTQAPVTTQAPTTTQAPVTTQAPATTQAPVTTQAPAATQATQAPTATQAPVTTQPTPPTQQQKDSTPATPTPTTSTGAAPSAPAAGPSAPAAASSATVGSKPPAVSGQDAMAASLSSILAGFGMPQTAAQAEPDLDLQDVLIPEDIFPLLSEDSDALKELFSHMPPGTQNLAGLRELLFSAQFGQTIDAFTHVVNSGHANALLRMFGFDPMLAGPVGVIDINGFITVLQGSVAKDKK